MARLVEIFAFLCLLCMSFVAATPFDQEEELRNSNCDNGCFDSGFPGGSCTDDAACMCTQQKYREAYFCCMAKNCAADVLPESIIRQHSECRARNLDFTFDSEAVCGIRLSFPTTAAPGVPLTTTVASSSVLGNATVTSKTAVTTSTGESKAETTTSSVTGAGTTTQSSPAEASGNSALKGKGVSIGFTMILSGIILGTM